MIFYRCNALKCFLFAYFAAEDYAIDKIILHYNKALDIDELMANHTTVSVHKYGFFLCRTGRAKVLLGSETYEISRNHLCIYTPNTFLHIIERSAELDGILEEDDVDAYYPVVSMIDIRRRLTIRSRPCVVVSERQADEIVALMGVIGTAKELDSGGNDGTDGCDMQPKQPDTEGVRQSIRGAYLRHLHYALCLKVLDAYFSNTPVSAVPQGRDDAVLNRFVVSLYENCRRRRTVQYYADEQHLSPYYFSSIIKERSGRSVLQWIEGVTMTFIRQYLKCTGISIKEIADSMDFPDQSTFSRYFKRHEGCTPSEYRARLLETGG